MSSAELTQSSTLPPAQPTYILRGHSAQTHAVHFFRENLRLLTGDADGWVVLWNLPTRRPVAVWKAHNATILGTGNWGTDRIITHGRDSKLQVWQLKAEEEPTFSTILPLEDSSEGERKQPWLLHSLGVSTVNFCGFAMVSLPADLTSQTDSSILIGTSGVQDGTIALTILPSEKRHSTVPAPRDVKTGMLMAVGLHYPASAANNSQALVVLAGYESGHAALWQFNTSARWEMVYVLKQHSQPILSLSVAPLAQWWYTSSADATIARYTLQKSGRDDAAASVRTLQTKHAGQQGLRVRSDEKIFATAGWDGRIRVYAAKNLREVAVLKWHREGCYALAFAYIQSRSARGDEKPYQDGSMNAQRGLTVAHQRNEKTKVTHWLAAGSKDGKISLWEIY